MAPADQAVAANFERFDGLTPLDNPAADDPNSGGSHGMGTPYAPTPRPGQLDQPTGQVYTRGPLSATVGVLGGQPLPVAPWQVDGRTGVARGFTPSKTPSVQWRLGDGQANTGLQQTIALSEITANPPQPGDLTLILAGQA
jgi:hypothetical protein